MLCEGGIEFGWCISGDNQSHLLGRNSVARKNNSVTLVHGEDKHGHSSLLVTCYE
jgi:hypothetical protein